MATVNRSQKELLDEIESLRFRLEEAEETLHAIGSGEVDAFVVSGPDGEQVFTLKGAEQPYRVLVETMNEGAATLSADGTILYCNNRLATMLQIPMESLGGAQLASYVAPATRSLFTARLNRCSLNNFTHEFDLITGAGNSLPVLISGCGKDPSGSRDISVVVTDLSELKKLQDADVARLTAESANRAKSEFLANMSHELRTPLNSVIGFSEVLEDELFGQINTKQHEYITNILNSGRHLLSLINDILDLSKVEAGKLVLDPSAVKLREVIAGSITMLHEKAYKHNLAFDLELPGDCDIELIADERKLKQIMYNLLSNAVKFTPNGGSVRITAQRTSLTDMLAEGKYIQGEIQPEYGDFLEIAVKDNGIGIKQEDIPRLFKEFSQLDSPYTKEFEGTGLGLALTKRLVELHGGLVGVESGIGKGSRFFFAIPVKH